MIAQPRHLYEERGIHNALAQNNLRNHRFRMFKNKWTSTKAECFFVIKIRIRYKLFVHLNTIQYVSFKAGLWDLILVTLIKSTLKPNGFYDCTNWSTAWKMLVLEVVSSLHFTLCCRKPPVNPKKLASKTEAKSTRTYQAEQDKHNMMQ